MYIYCNRKEYELLKQVQQHCLDFFMELVSQCCFSQIAPEKPTDAFFKKLLEIVTDTENEDYKDLFPFEEEYAHSCPIARSVLLQLLLEYKLVFPNYIIFDYCVVVLSKSRRSCKIIRHSLERNLARNMSLMIKN